MLYKILLSKLVVLLILKLQFILGISLSQLLLLSIDTLAIASPKLPQNNQIQTLTSPQEQDPAAKSRLDQSLEMINEMEDSKNKVDLLNDLALSYAELGYGEIANEILEQCLAIAKNLEDLGSKVTSITNIAKSYAQIGQEKQAIKILNEAVDLASTLADKSLQGQLLFEISLKYGEIGQEELAQTLFAKSQTIIAVSNQPLPKFPFTATPPVFTLGFSGNFRSFRDKTALVGINVDYSKQWAVNDIFVDGSFSLDYDSSRTVNQIRPISLFMSVYRYHFNSRWSFFTDFVNSTNQELFASKNDDEDLTIFTEILVGGGLNLWRGDTPSDFLDFQLGIGPRYEYDLIAFEQRTNRVSPTLAVIFLGRGVPLGKAKLNQIFSIAPALNDFENFFITSNTKLSIPLSKKWAFTNRLFLRYRSKKIFEENPNLEFVFSTGLDYEF